LASDPLVKGMPPRSAIREMALLTLGVTNAAAGASDRSGDPVALGEQR
jgi:hypothetical protein